MKIAVTGGSGFIGRSAIRYAREYGYDAWPFDHADGHSIMGDLSGLHGANVVINLAGVLGTAELFDDPHEAVDVNVHGALNILKWCERNDAGYVGITMPPVFPSVYTATKICADRLATAWHHAYGVPVSRVRAFNAYGPGQKYGPHHPQKFLPTFATLAWKNEPLPIWGDGEQTVDMIHVDDVGRMLVEAALYGDDNVFDAGTGVPVTVNEFAEFVLNVTGSKGGVTHLPMRKGEVPTNICAEGAGWDELGWKPEHNWERVRDAIGWYLDR